MDLLLLAVDADSDVGEMDRAGQLHRALDDRRLTRRAGRLRLGVDRGRVEVISLRQRLTLLHDANFMQGGADIKDLGGLSADALSGSFDEPLSKGKVLAIAKMFIKA